MTCAARFETRVPAPKGRIVAFFGDAQNLPRISPPYPMIKILSGETRVVAGAEFRIELNFVVFRTLWLTRVERVEPDGSFVDTFSGGVFRHWRHTHRFLQDGDGTLIIDDVTYEPRTWLRPIAPTILRIMFAARRRALAREFS